MNLEEAKQEVAAITPSLVGVPFVVFHTFERNGRSLHLALTERFYRTCCKGNVWQSHAFLTAIKNAEYGFDPHLARSHGGRDTIFLLDRSYTPKNTMMTKLFDRYLDMPDRRADQIAKALRTEVEHCQAARLVSHHQIYYKIGWIVSAGSLPFVLTNRNSCWINDEVRLPPSLIRHQQAD